MKTAYIFHDAFCDQFSDWYPWMKTTLEAQGYLVIIPNFPTPGGQSLSSWKATVKNYLDKFDNETIFIGHGTGGAFALRLLEETKNPIAALFLVASYAEPIGHVGYDRVNDSFLDHAFAWDTIKNNASFIQVFAGEEDPFVPQTIAEHLAEQLNQELHVIPGGGHINKASGFTQLVAVAQSIQESKGRLDKNIQVEETPVSIPMSTPVEPPPPPASPSDPSSFEAGYDPLHDRERVQGETLVRSGPGEDVIEAPKTTAHTMYQDMSQLVSSNKGTVASSLLTKARTDEEIKKTTQATSPKNILYILGTVAMLILALGIGAFIISRNTPALQKPSAPAPRSLIQAERHVRIDIAGNEGYTTEKNIRQSLEISSTDGITDLYYTNGTMRASFPSVLSKLGITTLPESLNSEFLMPQAATVPLFMHGSGSLAGKPFHFLVLPVSHYDAAFIGIKEWEPTLVRDTGIFMNIPSELLKARLTKDVFVDETINNRPVRTTRDAENNITLAYFFLSEKTIVIVDNPDSITELLKRYANSQIYN